MKTKHKAAAKPVCVWSGHACDAGVSQRLQDPGLAAPQAAAALPCEGQDPHPCAFGCRCTKCSRWQQEEERLQVRCVLGAAGEKGGFCEEMVLAPRQHEGRGWPWFYAAHCHHPRVRPAAQRPGQHRLSLCSSVLLHAGRSPEQGW